MTLLRLAFLALVAAALGGCLSPLKRETPHYHVLEAPGAPAKAKVAREGTLLVAPTTAASFYDAAQIAYSRAPGSRAYYQLNRWTEQPSRRIHDLLLRRLEASGVFESVASATSGVRGDLTLNTHLEELYHDAATPPGVVHVALTATLLDPARRAIVARRTFTRTAQAASYDATGAVQAFNGAVAGVLDEVVAWLEASAPR